MQIRILGDKDSKQEKRQEHWVLEGFGNLPLGSADQKQFQIQPPTCHISNTNYRKWTTRFCNDQSRYDKSLRKDTSYYFFVSENVQILAGKCNVSILATKCYFEIEDKKIDLGIGIVQIIFATWC
jgi:hypothetical protein